MILVSSLGASIPGGIALGLCVLVGARSDAAPAFERTELRSSNGAALLEWNEVGGGYEVEHAARSDFSDAEVLYVGAMPSAHVSGLRDGVHHFRVRSVNGAGWSAPTTLVVEHHSMAFVWPWFVVGAMVFIATAGFVAAQTRNPEPGRSA